MSDRELMRAMAAEQELAEAAGALEAMQKEVQQLKKAKKRLIREHRKSIERETQGLKRIAELEADVARLREQRDSLQAKVHLCTAYDYLEKRVAELEALVADLGGLPAGDTQ